MNKVVPRPPNSYMQGSYPPQDGAQRQNSDQKHQVWPQWRLTVKCTPTRAGPDPRTGERCYRRRFCTYYRRTRERFTGPGVGTGVFLSTRRSGHADRRGRNTFGRSAHADRRNRERALVLGPGAARLWGLVGRAVWCCQGALLCRRHAFSRFGNFVNRYRECRVPT
eukprot:scaffold23502_cov73-Phaeocystis_antarctica.AAC.1